jgi:putative transposase
VSDSAAIVDTSNPSFEPNRQPVRIAPGELVMRGETVYRITQIIDFESVTATAVESGRAAVLRIGELRPIAGDQHPVHQDLEEIADADWRVAEARYAAIKPLIERMSYGRSDVVERAKETGNDTATLYRWIKRYSALQSVTALVPKSRGWIVGKTRISHDIEKIIDEVIQGFYLTVQRATPQKAVLEVNRRCHERGLAPPSPSTVRHRLARIPQKEALRGRGHKERAKNKYLPAAGTIPGADFPLAIVEIDHTPVDIILVDDVHRKPIGRPWISLAIDVHSRMVTGYYLSFDPPSETSVAMCVAHSILPKEEWLLLHRCDAEWPVWGVPVKIHVDNGADFRSNTFAQSCTAYGINLEFRPVKQPRYGGTIERLIGTFMREVHALPGTTFSNVKERDDYDAEKHATMTKTEFEVWLVTLICKVYHQRQHTSIGMTPRRMWEIGILGNAETRGIGMPSRPADRHTVLLDFLPAFKRTVQTFGVTIDGLTYYDEALRRWINADDPDTREKRKFVFRRDPRDISSVWFFDPTLKRYCRIPFADLTLPSMSVWEYDQAKRKLKQTGADSVNSAQLLRAITELRSHVESASEKTKKARRQAQRRREHERKVTPATPLAEATVAVPTTFLSESLLEGDVSPFGEIA